MVRALALEASGYSVTVTELAGWEHSLKNELILGKKVRAGDGRARARLVELCDAAGVWPKLVRLKQRLHDLLGPSCDLHTLQAGAFAALADPQAAPDAQLPATGLPLLRERQLSSAFIRIVGDDPTLAVYGTRCATLVVVQQDGPCRSVHAVERSFGPAGEVTGEVRYDWVLQAR